MILENMIKKDVKRQSQELEVFLKKQQQEVVFPQNVEIISNVPYTSDQLMDIYKPTNQTGNLPVIINVHGGGLLLGNKEFNQLFCGYLCALGFIVFCVEYPLIPDVEVYKQYDCIHQAMNKIDGLLTTYHGDREHVYLVGDSAGAYLITYVNAMQNSTLLAKSANIQPSKLPIKALGLISGMFYTTKKDKIGLFLPKFIYGKNWKHHSFKPYTNPENIEIISHLAPCCLITTKNDYLRHYTINYYQALLKNHIECQLIDYPKNEKLNHAFVVMNPEYSESQEVIKALVNFLLKY